MRTPRFSRLCLVASIGTAVVLAGCESKPASVAKDPPSGAQASAAPAVKAFKDIRIRFFCGGAEGDAFASIVYKGAMDAQKQLGVTVDYVFSEWEPERMVRQLREAIAARPDAICMMGHPGADALMPLAEEAHAAGITMMYQNVDVPSVRQKFGGGYVGAELTQQGRALGKKAMEQLGLAKGQRAAVFGSWQLAERCLREDGCARAFEEAGLTVDRVDVKSGAASAPEMLTPLLTGEILSHPETRVIVLPGGPLLGAAPEYMAALKKKPGEIFCIGFDVNAAVIDAFEKGYVQLTSDQQPYLQGYLPVVSATLTTAYGLAPISFTTDAGFISPDNFRQVALLARAGIR